MSSGFNHFKIENIELKTGEILNIDLDYKTMKERYDNNKPAIIEFKNLNYQSYNINTTLMLFPIFIDILTGIRGFTAFIPYFNVTILVGISIENESCYVQLLGQ